MHAFSSDSANATTYRRDVSFVVQRSNGPRRCTTYLGRLVENPALHQTPRPGKDAGDRVRAGRVALLVLAVVARHRAVRGLGLERLAIGRDQYRGHQPQGAEALGHDVGLHVAVVVYVVSAFRMIDEVQQHPLFNAMM